MGGQHEVPQPQLTPGHSFGIATLSRQLKNDGRRALSGEAGCRRPISLVDLTLRNATAQSAAEERRAVKCLRDVQPLPAIVVLNMPAVTVLWRIRAGMEVYQKQKRIQRWTKKGSKTPNERI